MPGPVPKRSDQRRRTNESDIPIKTAISGEVITDYPEASEDWHVIAKDWYNSLAKSGQAHFYEPSDWQVARYIAQAMSLNLKQGKFSAVLFANVLSGMGSLLATEGDRRRMRVELEKAQEADPDEVAATAAIDQLIAELQSADETDHAPEWTT
jgi:hypothetical protein